MAIEKVILCWSSGKDSAWALHRLNQNPRYEVLALLTTITEGYDRVSMHGVRESLVEKQAAAAHLPLWKVKIPQSCTNKEYESRMIAATRRSIAHGARYMAFGDLFLEDVRAYRSRNLDGSGIKPLFPLWETPTDSLALEMISNGLKAVTTCIDRRCLSEEHCGREFNQTLLEELPANIDPCGEHGEFHTFVYDGPMFDQTISITRGELVNRGDFCFVDFSHP